MCPQAPELSVIIPVNKRDEQELRYTINYLVEGVTQHLVSSDDGNPGDSGHYRVRIQVENKISVSGSKQPLVYFKNCPLFYSFKVVYNDQDGN